MKFSSAFLTAILGIAGLVQALPALNAVNYDGTKVFRITLDNSDFNVALVNGIVETLSLSAWTHKIAKNSHVDVEVPKDKLRAFRTALKGVTYHVMHEDLGASITEESANSTIYAADASFFESYHPYAEHLQFMKDLVAQFPKNAETVTAGNSFQGMPITGIHIFGSAGKGNRPAVIFHGTVHAREWITTMVNQYMSFNLLTNYDSDSTIKGFVDNHDFYIFPVVNPDGFVYSQTRDRLWRKNRQPAAGSTCIGCDINRNWAFKWEVPGGASTNPCAETYKGKAPGDTPEFKGLSAFNRKLSASPAGAKMYIDWHAYSQLFMTPYGYSCTAVAPDNTELVSLARGAVAAIRGVHGTSYTAGPICTTIYQATGSSVDYNYDVSKIKYSFTSELRDKGRFGFVLPANQILPTAEENWAGVVHLLNNME